MGRRWNVDCARAMPRTGVVVECTSVSILVKSQDPHDMALRVIDAPHQAMWTASSFQGLDLAKRLRVPRHGLDSIRRVRALPFYGVVSRNLVRHATAPPDRKKVEDGQKMDSHPTSTKRRHPPQLQDMCKNEIASCLTIA